MAIAASCFALWLLVRRNFSWLMAAIISQVPFWVGLAAYIATGDKSPAEINIAMNLVAASVFSEWGHSLQAQRRGGVVHMWLCAVFVAAGLFDLAQLVYPTDSYTFAQELIHYAALAVIGGRAYVVGFDGYHRSRRDSSDHSANGGMV